MPAGNPDRKICVYAVFPSLKVESEKKHPKKSNTKICFLPPLPLQNSLCLLFFLFSYIAKSKTARTQRISGVEGP